jgi:hypothetical protein
MTKSTKGNAYASMGGRARAAKLDADRRREIAQSGLQGLADKNFAGDVAAAAAWLSSQGSKVPDRGKRGDVQKDMVKIDDEGRCLCPFHGLVEGAEYEAQDPAPCGCAWVPGNRGTVLAVRRDPVDFDDAG